MLFGFAGLEYYWFHTLIHFLQIQELDISRNHISDLAGLRGLSNLTVSIPCIQQLIKLFYIVWQTERFRSCIHKILLKSPNNSNNNNNNNNNCSELRVELSMELGMWWLVPLASFLRICIITLKVEGLKCMSWRCRNQHCLVQQNNILWKVLSVWGHWLDREEFFVICGKKIDRELIHRLKKTQNMEMTRVPKSHFHWNQYLICLSFWIHAIYY